MECGTPIPPNSKIMGTLFGHRMATPGGQANTSMPALAAIIEGGTPGLSVLALGPSHPQASQILNKKSCSKREYPIPIRCDRKKMGILLGQSMGGPG